MATKKKNFVRTFWQVTPAHQKKVKKIAKLEGVSQSQIMRQLIDKVI